MAQVLNPALFIRAEAAKPFAWGVTDCVSSVDRWVRACAGVSFVAALGLSWDDEASAITALGGRPLPVTMGRAMRAAGLPRTFAPRAGDVAALALGGVATCGIHDGAAWAFRDGAGWNRTPHARVLMAWRVAPCLR